MSPPLGLLWLLWQSPVDPRLELPEEPWTLAGFWEELLVYAIAFVVTAILAGIVHYFILRKAVHLPTPTPGSAAPWRLILHGVAAAWLPLGLTVAVGLTLGLYSPAHPAFLPFEPELAGADRPHGGQVWLFFLVQASFEELLFRGVGMALLASLLAWLAQYLFPVAAIGSAAFQAAEEAGQRPALPGKVWFYAGLAANLIVSLGFAAVHSENPGVSPLALINIALAGFALGQLYWLHGSLWGACAMHVVWNAGMATLGLPVSGVVLREPLLGAIHGSAPGLLTGGAFGPEASAVTTAGLLALSAWLVMRCTGKRRGPSSAQ